MIKARTIYLILILNILLSANILAQPFLPPLPEPGTAVVDGDVSEWDLSTTGPDFFANMYQAWNNGGGASGQPILSYLYLRYDCETETMYALVYQKDGTVPLEVSGDHWIAVPNLSTKVVDESDGLPTFSFVGVNYDGNGNHARGYEAKFSLNGISQPTLITAHANVDVGGTQTSGTGGKEIPLNADCGVLPVELSSFSVILNNNIAQLNWETATEVNNYGFEIQRSSETEVWDKVGFVSGHGNSNSPKYYSFNDQTVAKSGSYAYRLKQIDIDGQYEYSGTVNISLNVSEISYKLDQNYPNPFNPSTTINYTIPQQDYVDLTIYNVFGEEVARLVNEVKETGTHSIIFNAENLASGMYYYKIETDSYVETKKLLLLK